MSAVGKELTESSAEAHEDGFDPDLFFWTLKKTGDPPPGDERNHIKAMRLLKDINHNINTNLLKMAELSIIMSAVGKESSAGLLGRKEKKDAANKKKLVEGGLSRDSDLYKLGEKLSLEAYRKGGGIAIVDKMKDYYNNKKDDDDDDDDGRDIKIADGFDSALFFRTLEELSGRRKKKTDDEMQPLKEMHEKVKMEKKLSAQEQEKHKVKMDIEKNTNNNNNNNKKDDAAALVPATIGKKPLRASAPCPKVSMSKKQRNKAALEEFRRQFGPHYTRTPAWKVL